MPPTSATRDRASSWSPSEAASRAPTPVGRALARSRHVLFGRPLATEEEIDERLTKKKALAIFSSDAISSSAYATEEILRVLIVGGASAPSRSPSPCRDRDLAPVRGRCHLATARSASRIPRVAGRTRCRTANLGACLGLIAAAALLIDYVMTVAVSTASAIEQIYSVVPSMYDFRIEIAVVAITLITIANLRGLRESGNIFAVPTYLFVGLALLMIGIGDGPDRATGQVGPTIVQTDAIAARLPRR